MQVAHTCTRQNLRASSAVCYAMHHANSYMHRLFLPSNFNFMGGGGGVLVAQGSKGTLSAIGGQLRDDILGRGGRFDRHAANVSLTSKTHAHACPCLLFTCACACISHKRVYVLTHGY